MMAYRNAGHFCSVSNSSPPTVPRASLGRNEGSVEPGCGGSMRQSWLATKICGFFLILFLLALPVTTPAQTTPASPDEEQGLKPFGTFDGSDIDSVSMTNGGVTIDAPVFSYPQRGDSIKLDFRIIYGDHNWQLSFCSTCKNGLGANVAAWAGGQGVYVNESQYMYSSGYNSRVCGATFCVTGDGSQHLLGVTNTTTVTRESLDGSGLHLFSTSCGTNCSNLTAVDHNGMSFSPLDVVGFNSATQYWPLSTSYTKEDRNGNKLAYSLSTGWTDTLGRRIPTVPHHISASSVAGGAPTDSSGCKGPLAVSGAYLWTIPGPNGGSTQLKFCFATVMVQSAFYACPDYNSGLTPENMLQSIVLFDGGSWVASPAWEFEYNSPDANCAGVNYGDLSKITLPTGGSISYTWCTCGPGVSSSGFVYRALSSRTINGNDGSPAQTWKYAYSGITQVSGSSTNWFTTTVTSPLGDDTVYTVTALGSKDTNIRAYGYYITQEDHYQGSRSTGALLKTVKTDYSYSYPPSTNGTEICANTAFNVVRIRETTIWPNGQQSKREYDYDSALSFYDSHGNLHSGLTYGSRTAQRDYDYGSGAPGPLLRQTKATYMMLSGPNAASYLANNLISLPYTVQVLDGSGVQKAFTQYNYDETARASSGLSATNQWDPAPPTGNYRGNNTSVYHWLNSGSLTCPSGASGGSGSNIISYKTYFDDGNVQTSGDPCGHTSTYAYSMTYWAAFPTTVTNALSQSTNNAYDFNIGHLSSTTDPNSLSMSFSYDALWRLSQVNYPNGAVDTIIYQEASFPFTAALNKQINPSQTQTTTSVFDGFGRITQSQLNSDPQGIVYTDTTYDALGRVVTVSNPYRKGTDITTTTGVTTYGYDALSRKTSETYADNSVLTTAYCGPSTLVTDPTGRWRRSRVDGFGRLVEVDEPNAVGATVASTGCSGTGEPIWITSYSYDTLGNLTSVLQNGSRSRSFTYDSLFRLIGSTNPEAGTVTYAYWPDGPFHTKTDARSITTTHTYDALHREKSVSYSNGDPTISTNYDESACLGLSSCQNIGHRTSVTDAAGSEIWSFQVDAANHRSMHKDQRSTNGITKTTTYTLDYAGNTTQATYPTGRIVNYTFDNANRPSAIQDASNGITYATGFKSSPGGTCVTNATCYTPQGTFYALSLGQASTFNGLNLTHLYNSRLQPQEFKASSTGGNAIDVTYSFVDPANNHNAGQVSSITNNLDGTRSQTFSYDQLNRITAAQTTSTYSTSSSHCWAETYSVDPWGNLQSLVGNSGSQYSGCTYEVGFSRTADGNNHLSGLSYDLSGNTTNDGYNSYGWDAESQLKTAAGVNYNYDGDGRRIAKVGSKVYWYDGGSKILAETDASGNTTAEYIFFGGKRIAMVGSSGSPIYYVEDLLGTSRVLTTNTGTVCYDADFYPFGGERAYTNTCPQNYKFSGKERDSESGLYNFGARYDSSSMGRFMSADPLGGRLMDPQTLNKYGYVANNPLNFIDPTGLYKCKDSGKCDSDQDKAFEKARQQDLKSKDRNVVRAAKAYGDPNTDNGVLVQFGDPGEGRAGNTKNNVRVDPNDATKVQAEETVTIRPGQSDTDLATAIGHEGSHVADAQDFVATIDIKTGAADQSKNLTKYATELKAYLVTQSILSSANEKRSFGDCGADPCILGTGMLPAKALETINQFLANPKNGYGFTPDKPGPVIYPNLTTPK